LWDCWLLEESCCLAFSCCILCWDLHICDQVNGWRVLISCILSVEEFAIFRWNCLMAKLMCSFSPLDWGNSSFTGPA
jgi:hypothetical protein